MKSRLLLLTGVLFVGLQVGSSTSLEAQQLWEEKIEGAAGQWNINILRPAGMPVIPFFEGWVANEDGTANLCFGYFNLNYEEALEIPVGPDNFIEPARYNGLQPTYFGEVPTYDHRHYCAFTVNVPQDSGERVVWHLRRNSKDYSVPGHTGSDLYSMYNLFFPSDRGDVGGAMAPVVRFVDPPGPEFIGKGASGWKTAEPVMAKVGSPLTLTLGVTQPQPEDYPEVATYEGDPKSWVVYWWKHSGPPGMVTFSQNRWVLEPDEHTGTTMATFREPGNYVLRTSVRNEGPGGFGFSQCCWTSGYVEVTVTP